MTDELYDHFMQAIRKPGDPRRMISVADDPGVLEELAVRLQRTYPEDLPIRFLQWGVNSNHNPESWHGLSRHSNFEYPRRAMTTDEWEEVRLQVERIKSIQAFVEQRQRREGKPDTHLHHMVLMSLMNGNEPRVHPNGFVQLDLIMDPESRIASRRLHVWPDVTDVDHVLPKQNSDNTIHDHKFRMASHVVLGTLHQVRYDTALMDPTHEIYAARVRSSHDTVLVPTGEKVSVHQRRWQRVIAGETYVQGVRTFHDTHWDGLTATVMDKLQEVDHEPRVLCPIGAAPDNDYSRLAANRPLCWYWIEKVLRDDRLTAWHVLRGG